MSLLHSITSLLIDPPPGYVFELSEAGISFTSPDRHGEITFAALEPGVLSISPARDNVLRPEVFTARVAALAPSAGKGKRRAAAVILPDHAARVQVLDFDSFPAAAAEQIALIRFRIKKSVPFDVESATVSYYVQPANSKGKIEVVAAVIALEIVARYEAAFRAAGFAPGLVTTSALAALNLMPGTGPNVLVKLSGRVLSVMAMDGTHLKLVRTIELDALETGEVLAVLYPTLAYLEDEMASKVSRVLMCGFGPTTERTAVEWEAELNLPVEPLKSRRGAPGPYDAGLLGYLENTGVWQ